MSRKRTQQQQTITTSCRIVHEPPPPPARGGAAVALIAWRWPAVAIAALSLAGYLAGSWARAELEYAVAEREFQRAQFLHYLATGRAVRTGGATIARRVRKIITDRHPDMAGDPVSARQHSMLQRARDDTGMARRARDDGWRLSAAALAAALQPGWGAQPIEPPEQPAQPARRKSGKR